MDTPPLAPLCPACRALSDRWMDTTPSGLLGGGVRLGAGGAYDDTGPAVADRLRHRYERWRRIVRDALDHISRTCRAEHGQE